METLNVGASFEKAARDDVLALRFRLLGFSERSKSANGEKRDVRGESSTTRRKEVGRALDSGFHLCGGFGLSAFGCAGRARSRRFSRSFALADFRVGAPRSNWPVDFFGGLFLSRKALGRRIVLKFNGFAFFAGRRRLKKRLSREKGTGPLAKGKKGGKMNGRRNFKTGPPLPRASRRRRALENVESLNQQKDKKCDVS